MGSTDFLLFNKYDTIHNKVIINTKYRSVNDYNSLPHPLCLYMYLIQYRDSTRLPFGAFVFNVFINVMVNCLEDSKVYLFADDVDLVKIVSRQEDSENLQRSINALST